MYAYFFLLPILLVLFSIWLSLNFLLGNSTWLLTCYTYSRQRNSEDTSNMPFSRTVSKSRSWTELGQNTDINKSTEKIRLFMKKNDKTDDSIEKCDILNLTWMRKDLSFKKTVQIDPYNRTDCFTEPKCRWKSVGVLHVINDLKHQNWLMFDQHFLFLFYFLSIRIDKLFWIEFCQELFRKFIVINVSNQ